jgi:hypothetical protein
VPKECNRRKPREENDHENLQQSSEKDSGRHIYRRVIDRRKWLCRAGNNDSNDNDMAGEHQPD